MPLWLDLDRSLVPSRRWITVERRALHVITRISTAVERVGPRRLSVWRAWRDAASVLGIATSRLALILGIVVAEDAFNWLIAYIGHALSPPGGLTVGDLNRFL